MGPPHTTLTGPVPTTTLRFTATFTTSFIAQGEQATCKITRLARPQLRRCRPDVLRQSHSQRERHRQCELLGDGSAHGILWRAKGLKCNAQSQLGIAWARLQRRLLLCSPFFVTAMPSRGTLLHAFMQVPVATSTPHSALSACAASSTLNIAVATAPLRILPYWRRRHASLVCTRLIAHACRL